MNADTARAKLAAYAKQGEQLLLDRIAVGYGAGSYATYPENALVALAVMTACVIRGNKPLKLPLEALSRLVQFIALDTAYLPSEQFPFTKWQLAIAYLMPKEPKRERLLDYGEPAAAGDPAALAGSAASAVETQDASGPAESAVGGPEPVGDALPVGAGDDSGALHPEPADGSRQESGVQPTRGPDERLSAVQEHPALRDWFDSLLAADRASQ